MLAYILLLIGFVVLILAANWLVDSSISMARRMSISNMVIGLTIVSFGTSLPELIINLFAGAQGSSDLAVGNILGSNISNVMLILGITSLVLGFPVHRKTHIVEIPLSIIAVFVLWFFVNDALVFGTLSSELSRWEGVVLLVMLAGFIYYSKVISKEGGAGEEESSMDIMPADRTGALFGLGLIGLWFGGKLIVDNAITIARMWGMSEMVIGLTILALGTSLPELATCIAAVLKGKPDIAMGNIVGSNIFNVCFVLGLGATLFPIKVEDSSNLDLYVTIGSSVLLFLLLFLGKIRILSKWKGVVLVAAYVTYLVFLMQRS